MTRRFGTSLKARQERARLIYGKLIAEYGEATCTLDHETPLQLLIATILAAQCTDARVNIVTKELFRQYATAQDYLDAPQEDLERAIHSCGFYRSKARSIKRMCRSVIEQHGGEVPGAMEELLKLGGVGRKTANVILAECFGVPGVIVDTHCTRLANRLGFVKAEENPVKIERELMKVWDREQWRLFSHCMVFHGRAVCTARAPKCSQCAVRGLCPFPETRAGKKIAK